MGPIWKKSDVGRLYYSASWPRGQILFLIITAPKQWGRPKNTILKISEKVFPISPLFHFNYEKKEVLIQQNTFFIDLQTSLRIFLNSYTRHFETSSISYFQGNVERFGCCFVVTHVTFTTFLNSLWSLGILLSHCFLFGTYEQYRIDAITKNFNVPSFAPWGAILRSLLIKLKIFLVTYCVTNLRPTNENEKSFINIWNQKCFTDNRFCKH